MLINSVKCPTVKKKKKEKKKKKKIEKILKKVDINWFITHNP